MYVCITTNKLIKTCKKKLNNFEASVIEDTEKKGRNKLKNKLKTNKQIN